MNRKPIVYLASPYTKGDPAINVNFQMRMFDMMMNEGIVIPVVPLWTHYQHAAFPRPYKDWIEYDLALLPLYDACIRLPATFEPLGYEIKESSGADGEVKKFVEMNKPVFYDFVSLYAWAKCEKFAGPAF
jgi:hypothetical protein